MLCNDKKTHATCWEKKKLSQFWKCMLVYDYLVCFILLIFLCTTKMKKKKIVLLYFIMASEPMKAKISTDLWKYFLTNSAFPPSNSSLSVQSDLI